MEAVVMAREWQEEAKRAYDLKFAEAAEAEETYHNAIKPTLEKTEALEKQVKTVTMRADSLVFNEAELSSHRTPSPPLALFPPHTSPVLSLCER